MATTHAIADTFAEMQTIWADLGPNNIVSQSGLTVPASSLTLPAVAANGYVMTAGTPLRLMYVSQAAVSLTLAGGNGTYWLALHTDLSTAVAGWTRRAGSHYLWQMNATQPGNPASGYVFCQVTVAGGVITAVTPIAERVSQPMSKQRSGLVAITGGTVLGLTNLTSSGTTLTGFFQSDGMSVANRAGDNVVAVTTAIAAAGGTNRWAFLSTGDAPSQLGGTLRVPRLGLGRNAGPGPLEISYLRASQHGLVFVPDADTGQNAILFLNAALAAVGTIVTSATATAYNTTSDVRLKHAIAPLTDALERVRALRPVSHRWNADDSAGESFLAHELMVPCPLAVSGLPDEVNEDGSIKPQQVDMSKLIPLLTAGLQAALAQIDALTARITALEQALGA